MHHAIPFILTLSLTAASGVSERAPGPSEVDADVTALICAQSAPSPSDRVIANAEASTLRSADLFTPRTLQDAVAVTSHDQSDAPRFDGIQERSASASRLQMTPKSKPWNARPPPTWFRALRPATAAEVSVGTLEDTTVCPPCTLDLSTGTLHIQLNGSLDPFVPEVVELTTNLEQFTWDADPLDGDYVAGSLAGATELKVRVIMSDGGETNVTFTVLPPPGA